MNRIPFQLPDPSLPFLQSGSSRYRYADLYRYTFNLAGYLQDITVTANSPLLLTNLENSNAPFTIAACWLLQVPFLPLASSLSSRERSRISGLVDHPVELSLPDTLLTERAPLSGTFLNSLSDRFTSNPERVMALLTTSGTTAAPKLVPVRRRQHLSAAESSRRNLPLGPGHFWLLTLPLHHAGGINVVLRSLLYGSAIWQSIPFQINETARLLSQEQEIRAVSLVPTQLKRLLEWNRFRPHSDLSGILLGGGPVSATLAESCRLRQLPLIASYGMTETFGQIAAIRPSSEASESHTDLSDKAEGTENRAGVAGQTETVNFELGPALEQELPYRIYAPNQAEIRDPDGQTVPDGQEGLLWLRGPQLFDPQKWFNTGDYARHLGTGVFSIRSRRNDLILSGGENLVPAELEEALMTLKSVDQAAVTGLEDAEWGQIAVALVVMKPDEPMNEPSLKAALRAILAPHKIPKRIVAVPTLPKTGIGKIERRKLPGIAQQALEPNQD